MDAACVYCGGNCPNDEDHACDGYLGDIDGLYESGETFMNIDTRHGGPYDRGSADSYYRRPRRPHFFTDATYASDEIPERFMTAQQIAEYNLGFDDNEQSGNFKDWG